MGDRFKIKTMKKSALSIELENGGDRESMVTRLQTENLELRQKEKDYSALQTRLFELEHSLKLLQEYNRRAEDQFRDSERRELRDIDNLDYELTTLRNSLKECDEDMRNVAAEADGYRRQLDAKSLDIQKLKAHISDTLESNSKLASEKRSAESELVAIQEAQKTAQIEADRLSETNSRLKQREAEDRDRLQAQEEQLRDLAARSQDFQDQERTVRAETESKEKSLRSAQEAQKATRRELDRVADDVRKLEDRARAQKERRVSLELQLSRADKTLEETEGSLEANSRGIQAAKSDLADIEDKVIGAKEGEQKLLGEKEAMEEELLRCRQETGLHERMREEAVARREKQEQVRRKVEADVMARELELSGSKKELEKLRAKREGLVSAHEELSRDLDVIREHVDVLESQNAGVRFYARSRCSSSKSWRTA